jgi:hypothetical protein
LQIPGQPFELQVAAAASVAAAELAEAAALAALKQLPEYALAASPFGLLDNRGSLRLVTDAVPVDDALCLALTCRALRNALWARFPAGPAGDAHAGTRLYTRQRALVATVARVVWAQGLDAADGEMNAAVEVGARAWRTMVANLDDVRPRHGSPRLSNDDVCRLAARHGALATLQWAHADLDRTPGSMISAARGGHLEVLRWLRAAARASVGGAEWEPLPLCGPRRQWELLVSEWDQMCPAAAKGGHLAVLQWLQANG